MAFDRGGLELWESVQSRASNESTKSADVTFNYIIRGTTSDVVAKKFLISKSPALHDGMKMESASVTPISLDWWSGDVKYTWKEEKEKDEKGWPKPTYSFDTKGGTFHISHSLKTVDKVSATGEPSPDFDGGINVTKDKVEGLDVVIPKLSFSETHHYPIDQVDGDFLKNLSRATGKTNSDNFRTFEPGELLFLGASGSKGETTVPVTYSFEASENMKNFKVGPINIERKDGHHYLWTFNTDQSDSESGSTVNKLRAIYVGQIYGEIAFASLGLPDHRTTKQRKSALRKERARERNAQKDAA